MQHKCSIIFVCPDTAQGPGPGIVPALSVWVLLHQLRQSRQSSTGLSTVTLSSYMVLGHFKLTIKTTHYRPLTTQIPENFTHVTLITQHITETQSAVVWMVLVPELCVAYLSTGLTMTATQTFDLVFCFISTFYGIIS